VILYSNEIIALETFRWHRQVVILSAVDTTLPSTINTTTNHTINTVIDKIRLHALSDQVFLSYPLPSTTTTTTNTNTSRHSDSDTLFDMHAIFIEPLMYLDGSSINSLRYVKVITNSKNNSNNNNNNQKSNATHRQLIAYP
jgi:hypothetical protein